MLRNDQAEIRVAYQLQRDGVSERFSISLVNINRRQRSKLLTEFGAQSGIEALLPKIEKAARSYLSAHEITSDWPTARAEALQKFGELSTAWFAIEMYSLAGGLRDAISKADVKLTASVAFKLGAAWKEWKFKAEHEQDAMRGKKTLAALASSRGPGAEVRAERARRDRQHHRELAEKLWCERPGLRACLSETARVLRERHGLAAAQRTIRDHLRNR